MLLELKKKVLLLLLLLFFVVLLFFTTFFPFLPPRLFSPSFFPDHHSHPTNHHLVLSGLTLSHNFTVINLLFALSTQDVAYPCAPTSALICYFMLHSVMEIIILVYYHVLLGSLFFTLNLPITSLSPLFPSPTCLLKTCSFKSALSDHLFIF